MRDTLAWGLEAAAALRERTRRRLYHYVRAQPQAVGRDQAAESLGLSRATVSFHLDRLVEVGLLTIEYRRLTGRSGPGAGRPAKLYCGSGRTISLAWPHREHGLLADLLASGATPTEAGLVGARDRGRQLGRSA